MSQRAYIHITGPSGEGKTTLIERLIEFSPSSYLVARSTQKKDAKDFTETQAKNDPELARYRKAGAFAAARYRFKPGLDKTEAFWETELMENWAESVLIEGDLPIESADLTVFVTRPLPSRIPLVRRVLVDPSREHHAKLVMYEKLVDNPEAFAAVMFGNPAIATSLSDKQRREWQSVMKTGLKKARAQGPPPPNEKWAVAKGLEGIELAGVVIIHVTDSKERKRGESMLAQVPRLRKDADVYKDIIGIRGTRHPVTARMANLSDPEDTGLKNVLRRIRRKIRDVTEAN